MMNKFKLKPYKELLGMAAQAVDEALAPIRARLAQSRADTKIAEIEEQILTKEKRIAELATKKDLDLDAICDAIDEIALLELRQSRLTDVIAQLFPTEAP